MAKTALSNCDKMVRKALMQHGCQTSKQLHTYSNRVFNEEYSTSTISAALRKMVQAGMAAYSENERNQKVYWLTDFGKAEIKKEEIE